MSDRFLVLPGQKRKRFSKSSKGASLKLNGRPAKSATRTKRRLRGTTSSDDDGTGPENFVSDVESDVPDMEESDESGDETAADKRLRLAKEYLDRVKLETGAQHPRFLY